VLDFTLPKYEQLMLALQRAGYEFVLAVPSNSSPKVGVKQSPAVCGSIWDCDREPVALVAREAIVRRKEDLSQVAALLTEEYVKNK